MPASGVDNVTFRNGKLECTRDFYKDKKIDEYTLTNFTFKDIWAIDPSKSFDTKNIENCVIENVVLK